MNSSQMKDMAAFAAVQAKKPLKKGSKNDKKLGLPGGSEFMPKTNPFAKKK